MSSQDPTTVGNVGPADSRPLTEAEQKQVQRLLGDPFSYPITFKTWLVSFLEGSDMLLPLSAISGLTSILGIANLGGGTLGVLPAGIVLPYGGVSAPVGALLCDHGSYAVTDKPRLHDAIGYRFGGAGAFFNVPDLGGRVPVGLGPHPDHNAVGKSDADAAADRRVRHKHEQVAFASHGVAAGADIRVAGDVDGAGDIGIHDHGPTDGLPTPIDGPSFITLNFIIIE